MRKEFRMIAPGSMVNHGSQAPAFKKGGEVPRVEITIKHTVNRKMPSEKKEEHRSGYFGRHHETPAYDYHEHVEKHHHNTQESSRDLVSDPRPRPRTNIARDEPTESWAEMNGISKKVKTPAETQYLGKQNARRVKTGGYLNLENDKKIREQEKKLLHASNCVEHEDRKHPNNRTHAVSKHKKGDSVDPECHGFGDWVGGKLRGLAKTGMKAFVGYKAANGDQNALQALQKMQSPPQKKFMQQPSPQYPQPPQAAKEGKWIKNPVKDGAMLRADKFKKTHRPCNR
jgi:hypothetical protein